MYWLFEYCLNKCAHEFSFHFLIQSKKDKYNKHTNVWRFLTEPLDITSITLYLHTLRVFCPSPNINVKTLYSLSRERWIAFVVVYTVSGWEFTVKQENDGLIMEQLLP